MSNKYLGDQNNCLGQKIKEGVGLVVEEVQKFEDFKLTRNLAFYGKKWLQVESTILGDFVRQ
jgi:hypothetical protein